VSKIFKIAVIIFLLFEIVFSFRRHFYFPIDGDLPSIVVPSKNYQTVLHDPFGLNVLLHDSVYSAPNRFFTHLIMQVYFQQIPVLLQHLTTPVSSIYYSFALAKTLIQFFIIYLFAIYISGKKRFWDPDFLLAAALITPLFQIYGYNFFMGIIDHSISYTFFYALALSLVLLFFLPFFCFWFFEYRINKLTTIGLICLAIILAFNGPLNSPVILIICPFVILISFAHNFNEYINSNLAIRILASIKKIPYTIVIVFGLAILFCLYSFLIGKNNSENLWAGISIEERYARLPKGLYSQFTTKLGPALVLLMVLVNSLIIRKYKISERAGKLLGIVKWFVILSIVYILLLPFGGYRYYRPNIIRMDTIMPVTLGMMLCYGLTTYYIIKKIRLRWKKVYLGMVIFFTAVFINADTSFGKYNACERRTLEKISKSPEKIVFLDCECSVMSWETTTNYKDSEIKTDLLFHWNVIKQKKLFYQK
jgi:hypothetical protein